MKNEEGINPFLTMIQKVRDHIVVVGVVPQPSELVRLALNNVSKD